ncbi:hypothetical protein PS2015_1949 [Pseudohongiella spirulinae]|uniref:Uncharacterized protein n=1 Tax=Pseudohongiella spirulinae TaxID=1249552 RepID=A0A0S2KE54_9GAMM|nr:hypothetical protein PS2015_1949 [Pseudohongiella spirulinae]
MSECLSGKETSSGTQEDKYLAPLGALAELSEDLDNAISSLVAPNSSQRWRMSSMKSSRVAI